MKIHLQSFSAQSIAVGHQHNTAGTLNGLLSLYRQYGVVRGLWRGAVGAMVRIGVASSAQLSTLSLINEALVERGVLTKEQKFLSILISSMLGGVLMAILMAPFDLVSTRLYNQGNTHAANQARRRCVRFRDTFGYIRIGTDWRTFGVPNVPRVYGKYIRRRTVTPVKVSDHCPTIVGLNKFADSLSRTVECLRNNTRGERSAAFEP